MEEGLPSKERWVWTIMLHFGGKEGGRCEWSGTISHERGVVLFRGWEKSFCGMATW